MYTFLNLNPETFGMDINDSSIKIIKLKKSRKFNDPVSYNEVEMQEGIIEDGFIKDKNAFVKNIKKCLATVKGEKLMTKYVVASLPEEKSFSQAILMPRMEMEELKTAVPFEAENYIPFPINQMYLDFKKIDSASAGSNNLDIFISAVEKTLADSYVECLKEAGLVPVALEVETQAIARAVIKNNESLSPVAIIDLGSDTTNFIIFSGSSIRFTTSIQVSSLEITKIISEKLGITQKEAEHIKTKYGINSGEASYGAKAALKAIKPLLNNLVEEIEKYINFYSSHAGQDSGKNASGKPTKAKKISKIILTGGGSQLKGIDAFLNEKLKIPVEFGNPLVNLSVSKKAKLPDLNANSLPFTTAIGLALREVDKN